MNIVINGKNLQKRIINGQEVQKVIRNGVQIRPESTPPTPTEDYLCLTAISGAQIKLQKMGSPNPVSLEISSDKIHWSDYTIGDYINLPNIGDKVYFRNKSETVTGLTSNGSNYYYFSTYGYSIEASGDVNYLLCKNSTLNLSNAGSYCFSRLFSNCQYLRTAPKLPATTLTSHCYESMFFHTSLTTAPVLPATALADYCYRNMFDDCRYLTSAPVLPATTLANYCYDSMFSRCTALTTAPVLSATFLASYCYRNMFSGCTSLTSAPVLPATSLAEACYLLMFQNCTSLTTPPQLPATTLARRCYVDMFSGCTSLTTAPVLSATNLAEDCYANMFENCTSLTTAPVLPATNLANYCYYGMFIGCTSLITLPTLQATTLYNFCYERMFYDCSSIKLSTTQTGEYQTSYRIPTGGTGTEGWGALNDMFENTGGTFTGTPTFGTTYYTSNTVI